MTMRRPSPAQRVERRRRRRLDRIGDGDHAGKLAVDRDEDRRGAVLAQIVPRRHRARRSSMPSSARNRRIAERHAPPSTMPSHALAGRRVEVEYRRRARCRARSCRRDDRGRQRMLARPLEAGRQPQQLGFVEARRRHDGGDLRLAFGQRAGLVDDERVDLLHPLERLGVLDQHAGLRAAADADHDRHRRRQAERAGAGDDEDA